MRFSRSAYTASTCCHLSCSSRSGSLSIPTTPDFSSYAFLKKRIGQIFVLLSFFCSAQGYENSRLGDSPVLESESLIREFERQEAQVLSPGEKQRFLDKISELLQELETIDLNFESEKRTRSHIVGLENALIGLDSRLRSQLTKEVFIETHFGYDQNENHRGRRTMGLGVQVFVDGGRHFEWLADIGTISILRESDGALELPLQEGDVIGIRQGWVRLKSYNTLQLKVGMFGDEESLFRPKYWSFLSSQGLVNVSNGPWLKTTFRARHDRFSYLSPRSNSTKSLNLERNLSELIVESKVKLQQLDLVPKFSFGIHWYSDPDKQLRSLALGQSRFAFSKRDLSESQYRISSLIGSLRAAEDNKTLYEFQGEFWINHLATGKEKTAELVQLSAAAGPYLKGFAEWSRLGLQSMPNLAAGPAYRPGTKQFRIGAESKINIAEKLSTTWNLSLNPQQINSFSAAISFLYTVVP